MKKAKRKFKYELVYPYKKKINPNKDFVDIKVIYGGRKYWGSLTTTKYIDERMKDYRQTRENQEGSYFCAKNMIILKKINDGTIKKTLQDLIKRKDLEEYLES